MDGGSDVSDAALLRIMRRDAVTLIKLNRPETRNALSTEMVTALATALEDAEADPGVHVVVLTGGSSIFAAGADVRELRDITPAEYMSSERVRGWRRIAACLKPSVAAVSGHVLGGGCELALTCDLIVAGDNTVLGQPEVRLGLVPGAGGAQRWARSAGRFHAARIVLTGEPIDAWTAHSLGIVYRVVPAEFIVEAGLSVAEQMARFSPIALRLNRAAIRSSEELPLTSALEYDRSLLCNLLSTEDHREGIDALLGRRAPRFVGR